MEEKDVQRLLDMLFGMIDEAKSVAFSSDKCVINRDEALDLLDEIRAKLPLEIKKAKELIAARSEYVAGAKKEVESMLRQAELDARTIVSESETIQLARQKSSEIIRRAEDRSKELYHVANTYTEDALRRTEEAIQAALTEVQESRARFRAASKEQMQAQRQQLQVRPAAPGCVSARLFYTLHIFSPLRSHLNKYYVTFQPTIPTSFGQKTASRQCRRPHAAAGSVDDHRPPYIKAAEVCVCKPLP